jgi:hypothetical protein
VYATSVFVYTQRQVVVLLTGFSVRKYMPVYAKPLTLHKGVDNQLQFQFLNQEQKPVDITGKEITFRAISYDGSKVLFRKALTVQLGLTGIASLYVNAADIEDIDAQRAHYSLEIPIGEFDFPVFVDNDAGARGDLNIVNSVLPAFIPSESISIPTGQPFPNLDPNNSPVNPLPNANIYYSSVINTEDNPILTIQSTLTDYNGIVSIEGSTIVNGDWYPITTSNVYSNVTETEGWSVKGYHPYVRMVFTSNAGVVTNILAR